MAQAKTKGASSPFNGPENELVSAGAALGASFVALVLLAVIVHPEIMDGGDKPQVQVKQPAASK